MSLDLPRAKKLVMADGCFDPLHEGHVAYLEAARRLGDGLVVNMADDAELWQKRPTLGPLLPAASRARLLAALKPVDAVVCQPTAEALATVRPAIYVKGRDWTGRLPREETELCARLGIEIAFVDTALNSSTRLLEELVRRHRSESR